MPTTDLSARTMIDGQEYEVDQTLTATIAEQASTRVRGAICPHSRQVIKHEDWFLVCDEDGNAYPDCSCGHGLYTRDTRFLSALVLRIAEGPLSVLSSSAEQNFLSRFEYANGDWVLEGGRQVRHETLHVRVTRLIDGGLRQEVRLSNFNPFPVRLHLALEVRADFKDMFEVRGFGDRAEFGTFMRPRHEGSELALSYVGADRTPRQSLLRFSPAPEAVEPGAGPGATGATLRFVVDLPPSGGERTVTLALGARIMSEVPGEALELRVPAAGFDDHVEAVHERQRGQLGPCLAVSSSHPVFTAFIDRGVRDLCTLINTYPTGPYPVAGIPWFTCPFGRDGLITAFQALPLSPDLARGTLRFLAAHQGTQVKAENDEQPGKILHERREGELSLMGWTPFAPYYGSVDSTPLFLVLLSETWRWTNDVALVRELWPNVTRALEWIDVYGDADGDGFVEYLKQGEKGLANQGWKDSHDSVIHADWEVARGAIALAEVQGYVYDAKRRMAELARLIGDEPLAGRLHAQASGLKTRFREAFLTPEGYYAIALDGEKRQVRSQTSNPGHCLWSGLIDGEDARRVTAQLLAPDMFNGWGIRTMSSAATTYNPISYHNGTVWPHDCSLIAKGMADQGDPGAAGRVLSALFDAAQHYDYLRLPELFCGFAREGRFARPVPYPVACSPQAWAAGTPLLLLQSVLGLVPDAPNRRLHVQPSLPAWLPEVTLTGLRVGEASVDLRFRGEGFEVLAQRGDLEVDGR